MESWSIEEQRLDMRMSSRHTTLNLFDITDNWNYTAVALTYMRGFTVTKQAESH